MWSKPERLKALADRVEAGDNDVFLITSAANITYFTGIPSPIGSVLIAVPGSDEYYLLTNILEYYRLLDQGPRWAKVASFYRARDEAVNPDDVEVVGEDLASSIRNITSKYRGRLLCDLGGLSCTLAREFEKHCTGTLAEAIETLRAVKRPEEVETIEEAIHIAEKAFLDIVEEVKTGNTELSIAGRLKYAINKYGGTGEAFPTIVAFSDHAAHPHAVPSTRRLEHKDLILVDWGAVYNNYNSDMTRSFFLTANVPREYVGYVEVVEEAVEAAIDTVEPGVKASYVDSAARKVLEKHGLGRKFIHGLGHGVGVEVHEKPYIRPGSNTMLEPGMIFTIEPGVYIRGKIGVRIEDMVIVTNRGARVLTTLPRKIELRR